MRSVVASAVHGLALAACLLRPATAETVTVVTPQGEGAGAAELAAELGAALDRALARASRFHRLNDSPLLPEELRTTFGCVAFDAACAGLAGEAAESALVLWSRVIRLDRELEVRVELRDVARAEPERELVRYIRRHEGPPEGADPGVAAALDGLARAVCDDRPAFGAALLALHDGEVEIDDRPARAGELAPVTAGRHRVRFKGLPSTLVEVDVGGQEVLVISSRAVGAVETGTSPRRVAAWMAGGVAAGAWIGVAAEASELAGIQSDYDRVNDGVKLGELGERGDNVALATNVLVGVGVAATVTDLYLFLSE